jgi:flavodoxin short chain
MNHIAIIYWSGTGNTEAMANAILHGVKNAGAEAELFLVSDISSAKALEFDALALGCPAMGGEVLEETEFEPWFTELEGSLNGKKVGLFGSYGWGDGQWMRDWFDRSKAAGANLLDEGLMAHETPDAAAIADCEAWGAKLAIF